MRLPIDQIIHGDCLQVLPTLPHAKMVFADPPDNIGLKYDNETSDKLSPKAYRQRLGEWLYACIDRADVAFFSVNSAYQRDVWAELDETSDVRMFPWYFTFGQHRHSDCGNNYRPIFRIAPLDFNWNTDDLRIPSERQRLGDKRADPRGRVPGDVWGGPADVQGLCRIQGNNKERRKWHPTQHPEGIVERCVRMTTNEGDLMIDPFLGTGTTMRVCQRLNRRCIGIDLSETYCQKVSEELGVPVTEGPGMTTPETPLFEVGDG